MTNERTEEKLPLPFVRRKTVGRATVNFDLIEKILAVSQDAEGVGYLTDLCQIPISFPKSKKGLMRDGFCRYSVTDYGLLEEIVFYIHILNASGLIIGGKINSYKVNGKPIPFDECHGFSEVKLTKEGERFLELLRFFRGCAVNGLNALEKYMRENPENC